MGPATDALETAKKTASEKRAKDDATSQKKVDDAVAGAEKTYAEAVAAARADESEDLADAAETHDTALASLESAGAGSAASSWAAQLADPANATSDPWFELAEDIAAANSTCQSSTGSAASTLTASHAAALESLDADLSAALVAQVASNTTTRETFASTRGSASVTFANQTGGNATTRAPLAFADEGGGQTQPKPKGQLGQQAESLTIDEALPPLSRVGNDMLKAEIKEVPTSQPMPAKKVDEANRTARDLRDELLPPNQRQQDASERAVEFNSEMVSLTPGLSSVHGASVAITGYNHIADREADIVERIFGAIDALAPFLNADSLGTLSKNTFDSNNLKTTLNDTGKALAKLAENAPNRRVLGASDELVGLSDVRNFAPGLKQTSKDTCGLHCAGQILDELLHARTTTSVDIGLGKSSSTMLAARGGRGLSTIELSRLISGNSDDIAALLKDSVNGEGLVDLLLRGSIIAHVEGNHFVRPLRVFEDAGQQWVRIYDPAVGYYDQLLDSFITRTGSNNQMILIVGP